MNLLDRLGNLHCARGESLRLTVQLRRRDGELADITGLRFVWRIYDRKKTVLVQLAADGSGGEVSFTLGGDVTDTLGAIGLRHRVEQLVEDGTQRLLEGQFVAAPGPARLSGTGVPGEALALVDEARGLVIVDHRGAPGPAGPAGIATFPAIAASATSGHRAVKAVATGVAYPSLAERADGDLIVGVTANAADAGEKLLVQSGGLMIEPGWSWAIGPVFAGDVGVLVQSPPPGAWLRQIGVAVAPDRIVVNLRPAILLS